MQLRLNNEFALVEVAVDRRANGERLRITSVRTGRTCYLDPLMLEVLTWLPREHFEAALETPFGPEPELAVVRAPADAAPESTDDPEELPDGLAEADPR